MLMRSKVPIAMFFIVLASRGINVPDVPDIPVKPDVPVVPDTPVIPDNVTTCPNMDSYQFPNDVTPSVVEDACNCVI